MSTVLMQVQTNRPVEQYKESINRPLHLQKFYLLWSCQCRGYPINDAVTGGYPSGKTEIVFLPFTTQRNQFQVIKDRYEKAKL